LKGEQIFAVMPMAIFEKEEKRIAKSPYGGSFGGIVTKEAPNYSASAEIVKLLIEYLNNIAVNEIIITLPLSILDKVQSDTLFFSFLEKGFKIINSDISSLIVLKDNKNIENETFTSRARNMARKARKSGVIVKFNQPVNDFWKVMDITFQKHGSKPTHTFHEWEYLCRKFPGNIWCDVAYIHNKPVAGIGHIKINSRTDSSFYLCNDLTFYESQALSLMIYEAILDSQNKGTHIFDFGTSSVNMIAREKIFHFKESFGAIGKFKHTIQLSL